MLKNFNFEKTLYDKFLGFLIKKGNKIKAKKILDSSFIKLSKKTGLLPRQLLLNLYLKLNSFVEIKKVRIRRSSHFVPFSISVKRRIYLIVKWLMIIVNNDTRKIPSSEKIYTELFNLLKTSSSKSLKLRHLNVSKAASNRSNIHFRW